MQAKVTKKIHKTMSISTNLSFTTFEPTNSTDSSVNESESPK